MNLPIIPTNSGNIPANPNLTKTSENRTKEKRPVPGASEIGLETLKSPEIPGISGKEKYSDSIKIRVLFVCAAPNSLRDYVNFPRIRKPCCTFIPKTNLSENPSRAFQIIRGLYGPVVFFGWAQIIKQMLLYITKNRG